MITMRRLAGWSIYCWLALNGVAPSLAAENMSFRGTLIEQGPCIIKEEDKSLEFDFGDIQIEDIDGVNYSQSLFIMVRCDAPAGSHLGKMLMMRHLGTAADFDPAAVQTNIADFAINTTYNTSGSYGAFTLGQAFKMGIVDDNPHVELPFIINATPVKRPGADVQPGEFSATSTIQLEYQ